MSYVFTRVVESGYDYDFSEELDLAERQNPGSREAAQQAVSGALRLINSGVLGTGSDKCYLIGIAGHYNPDHAPGVGLAHDGIAINIIQRDKE